MTKSLSPLLLIFLFVIKSNAQINEAKFVELGGIEQWITIKGDSKDNPVVLFIHGGPGSVMSIYSDNVYGDWQNEFTLVNWDQRGAGRTYGRNAPDELDEDYWIENKLTLDQMVADGIALTEYLIKHLDRPRVVLIGTSWGSILGTKMALARPDLFYAYVGHAQFVNFSENVQYAYDKTLELALNSGDSTSIGKLTALGKPSYSSARSLGQMLRVVKKYEQKEITKAPANWWITGTEYDNEQDNRDRYNGDDYSFLYFAGHEKLGITPMAATVDFSSDGFEFEIPVYYVQGEKDILTSSDLNKPYFDQIKAPDKAYYLLPDAGHGHNQSVVDKQYQIIKEKIVY